MEFVLDLINYRDSSSIYRSRVLLFRSFNDPKICGNKIQVDFGVESTQLTLNGTPMDLWNICLYSEASEERLYDCNSCGQYVVKVSCLVPEFKKPLVNYRGLQKALFFYKTLNKVSCRRQECSGSCTVTATPNFHLYIHLPGWSPRCCLEGIPESIHREFNYR